MNFKDIIISKKERFSIGLEEDSGKFYISIPVSNGLVDYEEYYEIDKSIYESYPDNLEKIIKLVDKYRKQEKDEDLFLEPGNNRGVAL
jgi:hypothetical protein